MIRKYLREGIKNQVELDNFLLALKEPKISTKVNCGKNHNSPFEFLSDVILNRVRDFILWANRSGSKSYMAGLITWFKSSSKKLFETCILGGSESQSQKSYKAINDFWRISELSQDLLKKEPMITKTEWLNGSLVSILTASQKSVRGPHPQSLILDEIDEMTWEIFDAALSQPQSRYNIDSSTGIFSTNHNIGGTMDQALAIAEKGGLKLYKYCIWECLESCRDYNCSTCKLSSLCPGQQMKEADGYYKVGDFIKKLNQLSWVALQREWLCEKVGRSDLVYQNEFDEDIHFGNFPFNPEKNVILSIDWGGVDPFSIGVWQHVAELGWVRVDEVYKGNTTNPAILKECKAKPWWDKILEAVADPSRADLMREWREAGISMIAADNRIDVGIEAVKSSLKPVLGNPKIFFNMLCTNTKREFLSYRTKKDKIVDEDNHAMDETRYFVMHKIAAKEDVTALTSDEYFDVQPE